MNDPTDFQEYDLNSGKKFWIPVKFLNSGRIPVNSCLSEKNSPWLRLIRFIRLIRLIRFNDGYMSEE